MGICRFCKIVEMPGKSLGAHSAMCKSNPNYARNIQRSIEASTKRIKNIHGDKGEFSVTCAKCSTTFQVIEFINKFPTKPAYYCSRSCANSHKPTEYSKNKVRDTIKSKYEYIDKTCEKCENTFKIVKGGKSKRRFCSVSCSKINTDEVRASPEYKQKHRDALRGKTGGWRNWGGNGKCGTYNGILFQSTWELAWLIYQIDHGNTPTRCELKIPYINTVGKKCVYHPDFEMNNEIYEVKGYWSDIAKIKVAAAISIGYNINIIDHTNIHIYNDYCIAKYGKDFYIPYLKQKTT